MIELKPASAEKLELSTVDITESIDATPIDIVAATINDAEATKTPIGDEPSASDLIAKVVETVAITVDNEISAEEIKSVAENGTHEIVDTNAVEIKQQTTTIDPLEGADMTASMIQRRINTAEEAKAALAERRRLARVEAERQAEVERQRLEAEREAELKRQADEEERQRKLEEETLRLVEEQRRAEEQRLQQAIEEAKLREVEEKRRREEEEKQKIEREEQERKARDEAEKQKADAAERLKKEEKEREERRKRVEAIMSRTRTKGTFPLQSYL